MCHYRNVNKNIFASQSYLLAKNQRPRMMDEKLAIHVLVHCYWKKDLVRVRLLSAADVCAVEGEGQVFKPTAHNWLHNPSKEENTALKISLQLCRSSGARLTLYTGSR